MFRIINDEDIRKQAWEVCKDFLGGPWKNISAKELELSKLKGGVSCSIFRCALPEDTPAEDPKVPRDALFRIYGPIQEDPDHLVHETATFTLLSERKLVPKLYGLFSNGRLEEFIPSHSLNSDEMRLYAPSVARELAKIHLIDDVPLKKVPHLLQDFAKWIHFIKDALDSNADIFMSFDEAEREFKWITEEVEKANSPLVFCHNDLKGGNILYREDVPQDENPVLVIIDYEHASYCYREFDIAGYFAESCIDYDTPEYPHFQMHTDKIPPRQEQVEFLRAYFEQISEEGVQLEKPLEEEIEGALRNLSIFACLAHFKPIMWAVMMTTEASGNEFGYREFVKARKALYDKAKQQHLTMLFQS